jgi:hypothetical protein
MILVIQIHVLRDWLVENEHEIDALTQEIWSWSPQAVLLGGNEGSFRPGFYVMGN